MKKILLILGLLSTTAVFGQYGSISSVPQPYTSPSHPARASYAPIAQGHSVLASTSYLSAQGERPASDFPQVAQKSLGETARELRKQHEQVKKARIKWEN